MSLLLKETMKTQKRNRNDPANPKSSPPKYRKDPAIRKPISPLWKTVMKFVNGHSPITWAFFNYNHLVTVPSCATRCWVSQEKAEEKKQKNKRTGWTKGKYVKPINDKKTFP